MTPFGANGRWWLDLGDTLSQLVGRLLRQRRQLAHGRAQRIQDEADVPVIFQCHLVHFAASLFGVTPSTGSSELKASNDVSSIAM
jgi:hypothetical protein